jgi:DNA end-binding protein Ku
VGSLSAPADSLLLTVHRPRREDELASDWNPDQYTDDYRDNLMRLIEAKRRGKTARLEANAPRREGDVVDLMERLRRSLEGARGGRKKTAGRKTAARKQAGRSKSKRAPAA